MYRDLAGEDPPFSYAHGRSPGRHLALPLEGSLTGAECPAPLPVEIVRLHAGIVFGINLQRLFGFTPKIRSPCPGIPSNVSFRQSCVT